MDDRTFQRAITGGIPQAVAAGFFHRVKTAGWNDPPDETGMLEGQFAAPIEQVIAKLCEVISAKYKKAVAYHVYAQSMRGLAQQSIANEFEGHACQEQCAAEAYLKRAAVLGGGPVHLPDIETPPASAQPLDILMRMARAEQEGIAAQRELREMVGSENPFCHQIDHFMVKDQYHLDELWQLMPSDAHVGGDVIPTKGEGTSEDPVGSEMVPEGEEPPEPEEEEGAEEPVMPPEGGEPPVPDEKTAARSAHIAARMKEASSDLDLKEKGRERAVTNIAAEAARDKARRGERFGSLAGSAAGALGGAALGKTPVTRAAGGALGYLVGSKAGKTVGEELDLRKNADAKIIPFPNKGQRLAGKARKGMKGVVSAIKGSISQSPADKLLRSPAILAGGALLGAGIGASRHRDAVGRMTKKQREKAEASGGPITRKWLKSPGTVGAIQGGVGLPLSLAGGSAWGIPGILAGAAAPTVAGLVADKVLKKREDRKALAEKQASIRFKAALHKLAFGAGPEPQDPGEATTPEGQLDEQQAAVIPEGSAPQPPMAGPPGSQRFDPVNYLEAEAAGRAAQEESESGFYREKAHAAESQVQSMAQQTQQIQEQLNQLTQQAASTGSMVMQANQEASAAHDSALQQATLAARMRMGMQALRAQMMEIASQDPEQLSAAAGGPSPSEVGDQMGHGDPGAAGLQQTPEASGQEEPGAQPGTPGASPSAGAQPGTAPPGAGAPGGMQGEAPPAQNASGEGGQIADQTASLQSHKTGSLRSILKAQAPFMAVGAGLGAAHGVRQGGQVDAMRAKVDELKGNQDGGFSRALDLVHAQMDLAGAEKAKKHPVQAALKGGLSGASLGAAAGGLVQTGKSEFGRARNNFKQWQATR